MTELLEEAMSSSSSLYVKAIACMKILQPVFLSLPECRLHVRDTPDYLRIRHVFYISKMAAEPERKYSKEQLESEEVSKKDILSFLQENASKAVCVVTRPAQIFAQFFFGCFKDLYFFYFSS